jgi:hypothetical protein
MPSKDLADACMSLLNVNKIDNVFIEPNHILIHSCKSDKNHNQHVATLKKELLNSIYIPADYDISVSMSGTYGDIRFWGINLINPYDYLAIASEKVINKWLDCNLDYGEKEDAFIAGWKRRKMPDFGCEYDYTEIIYDLGREASKGCDLDTYKTFFEEDD